MVDSDYRTFAIPNRWCVHSYYSLCPYAPDGSGRILIAGADLDSGLGEVMVLSPDGEVLDRFGEHPVNDAFWHTGFWQTWSPDAKQVTYQGGSLDHPRIVRRDLDTGREVAIDGDMEGAPPFGEPILSGLLGMLYAAGYGKGVYRPDQAPVPFQARDEHGIFRYALEPAKRELALSVAEILESHPHRDRILEQDAEVRARLGDGITLMAYCLRWSRTGKRCLFFFGNHCTVKERKEPGLSYVFTANRDLSDIRLAIDLSGKRGGHFSWQPDEEHLIGYAPDSENPGRSRLAEVKYDGTEFRYLSKHNSGGHPSISPADSLLAATDSCGAPGEPGEVVFIDTTCDRAVKQLRPPRRIGEKEPPGRNPLRVCHHPVFNQDGSRLLFNTLPGRNATLAETEAPER